MIQHVAIEIRSADGDACARFWALLGFEHVAPPPALAQRAAWVQCAGTQVHLLFVDDPVITPQGHVAVVVDDYDGTLGALREAGLDPQPRTEHWGSPRCFVRCPAGHRIELMAFAPETPQDDIEPGWPPTDDRETSHANERLPAEGDSPAAT